MKIIIDAMGGDNAPLAPLEGAALAVRELDVQVTAVGDKEKMAVAIRQGEIPMEGIELVHASEVIGMEEEATDILKKKPDSSLAVACKLLAEGKGDALVSAGSTGALLVGGTLIVGRIKGIKRPAIGTVLPSLEKPWLLIDCGANAESRAEMLVQFAFMGAAYQEKVMGVQNPSVALANNGTEETKGTALQLEAFPMLQKSGLNFIGNIEGRDIPMAVADVVVCDGFTGNIILKLTEGVAKLFSAMIKQMFYKNTKTKLAGAVMKDDLDEFKKSFDYKEYGGAPLLGIKSPVIKAHGSSDALAIKNAVRQAKRCVENDVSKAIESYLAAQKEKEKK
ncbi:phosphate acyltransferase PlsX [Ruminococcaceae bacterium OttesenSCG-928-I18]|nr:phosphate acyltransferase PlsX [Ruminococcaceae bacterium OttesenSCG-928-I18]